MMKVFLNDSLDLFGETLADNKVRKKNNVMTI